MFSLPPNRIGLPEILMALAAIVAGVCGLFVLVATLRMTVLGWSSAPIADQWDNLVSGREITWSWLVMQHNEHRLFVPRLVFLLDRWVAAETNVVDFCASVLIQLALWLLLIWLTLKDAGADRAAKIWAAGFCGALLFWAAQYENFLWGFQVQFFSVVFLTTASFAVVAVGPATAAGAFAAALLSGSAAYTLASGVLAPILALVLGLWVKRPRGYLAILLGAAITWPASYLWGYNTPSRHSDPTQAFEHLRAIGFHFFVQIGGPFYRALRGEHGIRVAAEIGALGVALFLTGLLALLVRGSRRPSSKALAMVAAYVLAASVIVASGRVRFGAEQALSSRYATPVLAFWAATFLLWFSLTEKHPRARLAAVLAALPLALIAAMSEPRFVDEGLAGAQTRKLALPAVLAGVDDPRLGNLHPRPERVLLNRRLLLLAQTSVFAEGWTRLMGEELAAHFKVDDGCSGAFLRVDLVDERGSGWNAAGVAWSKRSGDGLERLLLVDRAGKIVGYGVGGLKPSLVGEISDEPIRERSVWWIGDFVPTDPAEVRAYAVEGDGRACLLGESPLAHERGVALAPLPTPSPSTAGYIDGLMVESGAVTVRGWGYLSGDGGKVNIDTDLPVATIALGRSPRPDVADSLKDPALYDSGILLRLRFHPGALENRPYHLCIWTDDAKYGVRALSDAPPAQGRPTLHCEPPATRRAGMRP